jgi:hypothetical protein
MKAIRIQNFNDLPAMQDISVPEISPDSARPGTD